MERQAGISQALPSAFLAVFLPAVCFVEFVSAVGMRFFALRRARIAPAASRKCSGSLWRHGPGPKLSVAVYQTKSGATLLLPGCLRPRDLYRQICGTQPLPRKAAKMCDGYGMEVFVLPVPFEYWCAACGQLRLCFDPKRTHCGSCGAEIIVRAEPGELNADQLREGLVCENGHWLTPPSDPKLPGMERNATGESRKAPKSGFSERGF